MCAHECNRVSALTPLAARGGPHIPRNSAIVIADLDRLATTPLETAWLRNRGVRVLVCGLGGEINLASPAVTAALAGHRLVRGIMGAARNPHQ